MKLPFELEDNIYVVSSSYQSETLSISTWKITSITLLLEVSNEVKVGIKHFGSERNLNFSTKTNLFEQDAFFLKVEDAESFAIGQCNEAISKLKGQIRRWGANTTKLINEKNYK